MESLLDGTSSIMKFFIAFVVVFALIAVTAWLIRRFGTGTLGGMGTRGRAPRLAVIEAGAVDGRRKLVLIRRDNTEHLLMIGGPTDIVVEANIVRGQSARESGTTRAASVTDTAARALPVAEETSWPLQPEATPRNGRATRPAALDDSAHWALPSEPAVPAAPAAAAKRSRSAETLAGLAAELSVRPAEPAAVAPPARPAPTAEAPRPKPAQAPAASSAAADQNLADMASRLEAALRRPGAPAPAPTPRPAAPKPTAETPRVAPPVTPPAPPPVTAAPPVSAAPPVVLPVAPPAAPEAVPVVTIEADKPANDKPAKQPDNLFGSLEEEMANLLGRPGGKPS